MYEPDNAQCDEPIEIILAACYRIARERARQLRGQTSPSQVQSEVNATSETLTSADEGLVNPYWNNGNE
jgi:hypothetical protein